jgi:hypothetical protein
LVFIVTSVGAFGGQMALWRSEPLIELGVLALAFNLACLRFYPWKTRLRKAFSIGLLAGTIVPIILWGFGILNLDLA